MGITLQNDLKLKFDKGVDKGTTRGKSSKIFCNSARRGPAARAARTNRAAVIKYDCTIHGMKVRLRLFLEYLEESSIKN